jgi:hypothetical protein
MEHPVVFSVVPELRPNGDDELRSADAGQKLERLDGADTRDDPAAYACWESAPRVVDSDHCVLDLACPDASRRHADTGVTNPTNDVDVAVDQIRHFDDGMAHSLSLSVSLVVTAGGPSDAQTILLSTGVVKPSSVLRVPDATQTLAADAGSLTSTKCVHTKGDNPRTFERYPESV